MQIIVTFVANIDVFPSANARQKAATVLVSHLFACATSENVRKNVFGVGLEVCMVLVHVMGI